MAVTVPTSSTLAAGTRTNSSIPLPTGMASGDYVLSFLANFGGATTPSGYTAAGANTSNYGYFVYAAYRKWQSGDGATAWTHASDTSAGINLRVSGADATTFLNPATVSSSSNASNVSPNTVTGVTTTAAGVGLVLLLVSGGAASYSSPTSPLAAVASVGSMSLFTFFGVQATSGASGSKSATPNAASDFVGLLLGVNPASMAQVITTTGLDASGSSGAPTVARDQPLAPAGLDASGSGGTATVQVIVSLLPVGLDASGGAGTPTVVLNDQYLVLAGLDASGGVGSPVVALRDQLLTLAGLNASGSLGTAPVVLTAGAQTLTVPGVNATGGAGAPDFYQPPSALPMLRRCPFCYDGCLTCGFTAWLYF